MSKRKNGREKKSVQLYRCIFPDFPDWETTEYCDVLCFAIYQFPLGRAEPVIHRAIYQAWDIVDNKVYYKRVR